MAARRPEILRPLPPLKGWADMAPALDGIRQSLLELRESFDALEEKHEAVVVELNALRADVQGTEKRVEETGGTIDKIFSNPLVMKIADAILMPLSTEEGRTKALDFIIDRAKKKFLAEE